MHNFWVMDIRLPFALYTCIASLLKIVIFMAVPVKRSHLFRDCFVLSLYFTGSLKTSSSVLCSHSSLVQLCFDLFIHVQSFEAVLLKWRQKDFFCFIRISVKICNSKRLPKINCLCQQDSRKLHTKNWWLELLRTRFLELKKPNFSRIVLCLHIHSSINSIGFV